MKKTWIAAVIGLVLILGVIGFTGCSGTSNGTLELKGNLTSQQEGIWVSAEGKVTAIPDIANVSLGVEAQADTVAEAREQAAAAMEDIIAALKDQGVAESDIQTQYYNISDLSRWDDEDDKYETYGYRVSNTVTATLRDVETAGLVIDAVAEAGGDLTRVNSISFELDDPQPYYEEARDLAIEYAAAKAQQLAEKAGVNLGEVTYITESSDSSGVIRNVSYDYVEAVSAGGTTTSISAGELDITTTVQMAYAIE